MSVDARSIMRAGLQMICRAQDDLEFVGEAVDFASSYSVTQLTCPDVIVFDPGDDAVARDRFIEQTEGLLPDVGMLAFTRGDERTELTIKDMTGVVRGFVTGEAAPREILMAIRSVAQGKVFICH